MAAFAPLPHHRRPLGEAAGFDRTGAAAKGFLSGSEGCGIRIMLYGERQGKGQADRQAANNR